jgi:hypothetical protein
VNHTETQTETNSLLQSNNPSFNHAEKKSGKLNDPGRTDNAITEYVPSYDGRLKILKLVSESHQNANWNWNSLLQRNNPNFNPIAAKM